MGVVIRSRVPLPSPGAAAAADRLRPAAAQTFCRAASNVAPVAAG
jgi:hypothetical protein